MIKSWENEPNNKKWSSYGFDLEIKRHEFMGHLLGYIDIKPRHPWYKINFESEDGIEVHDGVTYSHMEDDGETWRIGFDCDRDMDYVTAQCESLAEQAFKVLIEPPISTQELIDELEKGNVVTNFQKKGIIGRLKDYSMMLDQIKFPYTLVVGDIVQLDPEKTGNKAFAGCLMIVTEIESWGVQGYVPGLGTREVSGGQAYYRAEFGTFEPTGGKSVWLIPT